MISAETSTIKYEYIYDDRGNILTEKEYAVTVDENGEKVYTLIEANTDTYVYDETWKDKLISYNGQTITYDAVGNPTNYMGNTLTWTMGRQLASFGGISYTYNEDGIRTSKTSNGVTTRFYFDGTNIIEQTDGTTTLYFFYDSVGEIIGFKYNGNNYLYVKNSMGDIVGIADADGNLIASYKYDAWGKVTSVTGSNTVIGELNPFRYRSYYYDSDIQLYYLQSRYYDPEIGRFINADDVRYLGASEKELSYNTFLYCENNPINFIDVFGNKKSLNSAYVAIYSILFLVVVEAYKSAFEITSDSNKKGAISIDLTNNSNGESFSNAIFEFYELIGDNVFDVMAAYATTLFYDEYHKKHNEKHNANKTEQRYFLFSDDCVSNEIKQHVLGYWYAEGKISIKPMTIVLFVGSRLNKTKLKDSCEVVNIAEQDAARVRDRTVFGYFTGIRNCYKYTSADPYAHPVLINNEMVYAQRTYQNVRNTWKNKPIPTHML